MPLLLSLPVTASKEPKPIELMLLVRLWKEAGISSFSSLLVSVLLLTMFIIGILRFCASPIVFFLWLYDVVEYSLLIFGP
jgi:hypothetical protein